MIHKRAGFTIIEIVVVMVISAMMTMVLYTTFQRMMQTRTGIVSRSSFVTHMPLIYQQLARDINGMYIPEPAIADMFVDSQEERQQSVRADTACIIQTTGEQFSYMTGITTNPMTLEHIPNRVRFVYQLVYDEQSETAALYRYQTADVTRSVDEIKQQDVGFVVLDGITNMEVQVYAPEQQERNATGQQNIQTEQQQEESKEQKEQQTIAYQTVTQWDISQAEDKPQYIMPAFIAITLRGTDQYDRTFEETYQFAIAAYSGIQNTYTKYKEDAEQQKQQQQQGGEQQQGANQPQQTPAGQKQPQQQNTAAQQQQSQQQQTTRRQYIITQESS